MTEISLSAAPPSLSITMNIDDWADEDIAEVDNDEEPPSQDNANDVAHWLPPYERDAIASPNLYQEASVPQYLQPQGDQIYSQIASPSLLPYSSARSQEATESFSIAQADRKPAAHESEEQKRRSGGNRYSISRDPLESVQLSPLSYSDDEEGDPIPQEDSPPPRIDAYQPHPSHS
jgi:hypothetical protein